MFGRNLCSIFYDMRKCSETKNFSYLDSLIEEAQVKANRMEAALWDSKKLEFAINKFREFKDNYKEFKNKHPDFDFSELDELFKSLKY